MTIKEKAISSLLLGVFSISFLLWTFKVYQHFFEFKVPDQLAVMVCFGLAFWLGSILRGKWKKELIGLLSVVTIFSLYPTVSFLIQRSDYSWLTFNVLAGLVGFFVSLLWGKPNWSTALLMISSAFLWVAPYDFKGDQILFSDKLIKSVETRKGKMHLVQWKNQQWWHYNKRLTSSSMDSHLYYEPLVHPVFQLSKPPSNILIIGGDNGKALQEVNKYSGNFLTALPFDLEVFKIFNTTFKGELIEVNSPYQYLEKAEILYDLIIIDLPDPTTVELNQYYSSSFYDYCRDNLKKSGYLVTQASSPYLENTTHHAIVMALLKSRFNITRYHNQIPSTGQWSWVIGSKDISSREMEELLKASEPSVPTKWWNQEAMHMMMSFGKEAFFQASRFQTAGHLP